MSWRTLFGGSVAAVLATGVGYLMAGWAGAVLGATAYVLSETRLRGLVGLVCLSGFVASGVLTLAEADLVTDLSFAASRPHAAQWAQWSLVILLGATLAIARQARRDLPD